MSVHNLTRPIVGIENRTAQEVFDIMRDRILSALEPSAARELALEEAHADDVAVDRFAVAMKEKLAKKRAEGRGGWENKDECSAEYLSYLLIQHIWKGDPVDIANLAMMLHQRGERVVIDSETSFIIPDHADAGKVEGDDVERTEFNRGYVLACANIVNLHGPDVNVAEGFAQLNITRDELKNLDLCEYDQNAINALEDFWGLEKLYVRSAPSQEVAGS